jgi:hypothetical protein
MTAFAKLQKLARTPAPVAHCDLCGTGLPQEHGHLLNPSIRNLVCACTPCSLLFSERGETKLKRVPRDARSLANFQMTDGQWDSLMIPIGLAFFYQNSVENRVVAQYPSPAGATESLLSLDAWEAIVQDNPVLVQMVPDVEVLLANRLDGQGEYYLAPIDKVYGLVGLIRTNWRGLSGGTEAWEKIRNFFDDLKRRAYA